MDPRPRFWAWGSGLSGFWVEGIGVQYIESGRWGFRVWKGIGAHKFLDCLVPRRPQKR